MHVFSTLHLKLSLSFYLQRYMGKLKLANFKAFIFQKDTVLLIKFDLTVKHSCLTVQRNAQIKNPTYFRSGSLCVHTGNNKQLTTTYSKPIANKSPYH